MENRNQSEQTEVKNVSFKDDEKAARKARQTERRLARRAKRNARIARGRHLKNLFIWLLGVLFLPTVIAVASFIVPISIVTGKDGKIVSEELSNKSLFEAVRFVAGNSGELGFADFPIVANTFADLQKTQIGEKGDGENKTPITVGDLIYIDTDKLNTIKFGSSDFSGDVSSCIEVVATIDSLGGAGALGDFGGLSVFTDEELAGTVAEIDARGETAEEKLQYYYKPSELGTSAFASADATYERAFYIVEEIIDVDGNTKKKANLVDKLNALSNDQKNTVKLYYPPLEKVKLGELKDIIGDSIGRTTISSLLEIMGGSNETLTDIIGEDTTIKGLKDFSIDEVKLSKVLEAPTADNGYKNQRLYDILRDATGVTGATDEEKNANISIDDLSHIDTDNICLSTVLEVPTAANGYKNQKLYDILRDATGVEGATDEEKNANISISDLSHIDTDNIYLSTVLELPTAANGYKNQKLYDILRDATGVTGATDEEKNANIKVSHLSDIQTDDIYLSTVLEIPTAANGYKNQKLYDILLDVTPAAVTEYGQIKVNHLSSIETDNLHLSVVLEDNAANAKLYDILKDLTGETTNGAITVGSLSGLDTDDLHLTTVIPSSDNKLLKPLLERNPTIGTLGDTINDIDVSEIFAVECFTEDSSKAVDTNAKYTKSTVGGVDHYDLSASGTYYISTEAKVWLFMLYDTTGGTVSDGTVIPNTKGSITEYEKKSVTFGNMEDGMSDTSDAFMNATVKQLIQSGILTESSPGQYSSIYDYSLNYVLSTAATIL